MSKIKNLIISLAVTLLIISCTSTGGNKPPSGANYTILDTNQEYEIREYSIHGNKVNALRCLNGSIDCNYNWQNLCKTGEAKNSDPWGKIDSAPAYIGGGALPRMRLFICK